jgi:4-hydroxy-2-oxoheptanedioate aldolase
MTASQIRARWRAGECVYAAAVRLDSAFSAELMALSGLDIVWLDQQHGMASESALLSMMQAMSRTSATSVVRVAANDPVRILRAVDSGADGIIVPQVETGADAARAVGALTLGPHGTRSWGTSRSKYLPGGLRRELLCLVMIETAEGVENAAAIASTPGVDGVFIGPNDLAASFGVDGNGGLDAPGIAAAIAVIQAECKRAGKVCGATGSPAELRRSGYQLISVGADTLFIEQSLARILADR